MTDFVEKPQIGEGWINGGSMVVDRRVLERFAGDGASFEADVLVEPAKHRQMIAHQQDGPWQCLDNLRDTQLLWRLGEMGEEIWQTWI